MRKWQLCALALISLLTAFTCVGQMRQGEEKITTSTDATRILWQFDTGG
jgi:hypothetical protein